MYMYRVRHSSVGSGLVCSFQEEKFESGENILKNQGFLF